MKQPAPTNGSNWAAVAAHLIVLTGSILWIIVWLQNRSLFIDEANLARNIAEKDLAALLLNGLDYQQYAPPFFLFFEKISFALFGSSELSLRLFPLLNGLVALWLMGRTGRSFLPSPWLVLFPLWLMAFSPDFLRYATELKQYSTDLSLTLGIVYCAWRYPPEAGAKWRTHGWSVAGAVAVWLSMPTVFALSAAGVYAWRRTGRTLPSKRLIFMVSVWIISFALYYGGYLSEDLTRENLLDYHRRYFLPFPPASAADWQQAALIFRSILRTAFGYTAVALAAGGLCTALGVGYLYRKHRDLLILLVLPLLICWGASAWQMYSLMPRLTLFFIPLLWLLAAFGMAVLWQTRRWWWRGLVLLMLAAVLPLQNSYRFFVTDYEIEEIKPVLRYLDEHYQASDRVYVSPETVPAFRYYTEHHPLKDRFAFPLTAVQWARWSTPMEQSMKEPPPAGHCWWLIFSHLISEDSRQQQEALIAQVVSKGYQLADSFEATGAACYCLKKKDL